MKTTIVFFLIAISCCVFGIDAAFAGSAFKAPSYGLSPVTGESILDKINFDFAKLVPHWGNIISGYASSLFWKLAVLDFSWSTIVWVKDRKDFGEILTGLVGKIVTIGFFWLLLISASEFIPSIIESFAKIGQDAAGTGALSPDAVFNKSLSVVSDMYGAMGSLDITDRIAVSFGVAISAVFIVVGHAMIAGQLLVTQIETYIAIGAGVILLGFGGSRWTSDMSSSYLKFAVGSGIKLMLCYIVIGAGLSLFTMTFAPVDAAANGIIKTYIIQSIALAGEAVVFVYMAFTIPGIASAMMSGSPNMSLGGVAGAAITSSAAVAGAGSVAAAAASNAHKTAQVMGGRGSMLENAARVGSGMLGTPGRGSVNLGDKSSRVMPPGSGLSPTGSFAPQSISPKASNGYRQVDSSGGHPGGLAGDLAASDSSGKLSGTENSSSSPTEKATSTPSNKASPSLSSSVSSSSGTSDGQKSSDTGGSFSPAGNASSGQSGQGDASGASIGGGSSDPHTKLLESMNKNLEMMANGPEQARKLHQKISSLRDFIPNDGATVQTSGISMGHTRD